MSIERNAEIIRRYAAGDSVREIAPSFGITISRVYQVLTRAASNGLVKIRVRGWPPEASAQSAVAMKALSKARALERDSHRNDRIVSLVASGLSYSEAAANLGVSRSTVAGAVHRQKRRDAA